MTFQSDGTFFRMLMNRNNGPSQQCHGTRSQQLQQSQKLMQLHPVLFVVMVNNIWCTFNQQLVINYQKQQTFAPYARLNYSDHLELLSTSAESLHTICLTLHPETWCVFFHTKHLGRVQLKCATGMCSPPIKQENRKLD